MNSLIFSSSPGVQHHSFFDFESNPQKKYIVLGTDDFNDVIENAEIGFSDNVIKDLAEEISNELITMVKSHFEK